jgi:hypothetical protein
MRLDPIMYNTLFNNIQETIQELKFFSEFKDKSKLILRFEKYFDITKDFENNEPSFELIEQLKQSYQELQDCIKNSVYTFGAEILEHFIKDLNSEIGLVKDDIVSKQCHHCDTSVDQLKLHILKILLRSTKELSVIGTDQQSNHSTPIIGQPAEDSLIELSHSFLDKGVKIEELGAVMGLGAKNQDSTLEEKECLELLGKDDDISFY